MTTTLEKLDQQCYNLPVPAETKALLFCLNNQRDHVLGILDGLTEDQLRRPVLPQAGPALEWCST